MDKNLWKDEDVFGELQWVFQRKKKYLKDLKQIRTSQDIYDYIKESYEGTWDLHETVYVVFFNSSLKILGRWKHSQGSLNGSVVDSADIIARALTLNARGMVLIHNHPSGYLKASTHDINVTERLKEACKVLDMILHDSLIINEEGYVSII